MRINSYWFYIPTIIATIFTLLPWYSDHLVSEASNSEQRGDIVRSQHMAERAVSMNPISIKALHSLAGTEQKIGRENAARDALLKATVIQPLNFETWRLLALYERDVWNQQELSRQHFDISISLNPYDEELQEEIAMTGEKEDT